MRITTEQWKAIQQAIKDGNLTSLIEDMLDEARDNGIDSILEDPTAYGLFSHEERDE